MTECGKQADQIDRAELLELIIESSTDFAIFTIDEEGIISSWNTGASRLFGFTESEAVGSSGDVIFTADDRASGRPERERDEVRRCGRAEDERWHQRKDGSKLWGSGLVMPLRNGGRGFVKIVRDRTERRLADEQMRESEERFRTLATSIPQLVFRTRWDGARTWGSPQWIDFTGLSLDESLGFGWLDAIHPEERAASRDAWAGAAEAGEYYFEHRVWRQSDGRYRWHQTRAKPIEPSDPRSTEWVGTMTDIHELRGLQEQQHVLMAELQHRTRNLLAVVQSVANRTIRKSASLAAFQTEFAERLRAISRVQSLFSRNDPREIDLRCLLQAELAAHGYRGLEDSRIELDGPKVVLPAASAQALALAIHELATNAVKYGALAGEDGRLSVTWTLQTEATPPRVDFSWREVGVAMPAGVPPERRGYGRELIERALPFQLDAESELIFGPNGVSCAISVPIARLEENRPT